MFIRLEDHRDHHVAVADPADPTFTIVNKVADTMILSTHIMSGTFRKLAPSYPESSQ